MLSQHQQPNGAQCEEDQLIDLMPACRHMVDLLGAVTDDQLLSSTPCTEYTLGELIEHVDEVAQGFTAVAGMDLAHVSEGAKPEFAVEGTHRDPAHVAEHVYALGMAWDDSAAWQGSTDTGGLELSNELWGKIALTEMVVHSWDIACSIGRTIELPARTLRACFDHVAEFVPNAPVPELWGRAVEVPTSASLLDRIVAITGRTPQRLPH